MNKIIIACVCLFAFFKTQSQDIFILAYKGKVRFNDIVNPLLNGYRYTIPNGARIEYDEACKAIVYTKANYFEIPDKIDQGHMLSYQQITSKLKSSASAGFISFLEKNHKLATLSQLSKGAIPGGIKGFDDNAKELLEKGFNASPVDSGRLVSDEIHLSWRLKSKIAGAKILVIYQSKDTVLNQVADQEGDLYVPIKDEGSYQWLIYSKIENTRKINRSFFKLNEPETKKILQSLDVFKKDAALINVQLKELIIADFMYCNKIIEE